MRLCEQAWSAKTSLFCNIKQKGLGVLKSGLICEIMWQIKLSHSWMSVCLLWSRSNQSGTCFLKWKPKTGGEGHWPKGYWFFRIQKIQWRRREGASRWALSLCVGTLFLFFSPKKTLTPHNRGRRETWEIIILHWLYFSLPCSGVSEDLREDP